MTPPDDDLSEFGLDYANKETAPAVGGEIFRDVPQAFARGGLDLDSRSDGLDEIIDSLLNPGTVANPGLRNAILQRIQSNRPVLRTRAPQKAVTASPITFSSPELAPGDTSTLTHVPTEIFRLGQITIVESTPGNTEIQGIFFGQTSVFSTTAVSFPCSLFAPGSPGVKLPISSVNPYVHIRVQIKNVGKAPCRVNIVMEGTTLR